VKIHEVHYGTTYSGMHVIFSCNFKHFLSTSISWLREHMDYTWQAWKLISNVWEIET